MTDKTTDDWAKQFAFETEQFRKAWLAERQLPYERARDAYLFVESQFSMRLLMDVCEGIARTNFLLEELIKVANRPVQVQPPTPTQQPNGRPIATPPQPHNHRKR